VKAVFLLQRIVPTIVRNGCFNGLPGEEDPNNWCGEGGVGVVDGAVRVKWEEIARGRVGGGGKGGRSGGRRVNPGSASVPAVLVLRWR